MDLLTKFLHFGQSLLAFKVYHKLEVRGTFLTLLRLSSYKRSSKVIYDTLKPGARVLNSVSFIVIIGSKPVPLF